ncbi:RED-like protein N-terminal region-domain-containing protein [Butyriboletus roseoflavus]|nr:RED-like protein N-terminal region-domain-containing protein [Butyriboletus roseoflavus]
MDQDAFRNLLASSRRSQANAKQAVPTTRQKALVANFPPSTTSTPSEPAFKPRKVKKTESKYRDRAAERRDGVGNDYAQVEAVLDDFEKRLAHEDKNVIEQQRKYLGGDSQHTILVKGLDVSLLEQNRARAVASTEDDEFLEQAFAEATSIPQPTEPQKRTREDIIRHLKAKQQNEDGSADQPVVEKSIDGERAALEQAKKAGKFRPIGFKPIGRVEERLKKRKGKEGKEGVKKKKQKVESQSGTRDNPPPETPTERDTTEPSSSKTPKRPPEPEPAPLDEDFDIFAGAGDYEGFPDDEESEEEHGDTEKTSAVFATQETVSLVPVKGWFDEPEPEVGHASIPSEKSPPIPDTTAAEAPQETRLKPLESSALPSIRDFLAMDEAAEVSEKRKARKEKKKKKKKDTGDDDD